MEDITNAYYEGVAITHSFFITFYYSKAKKVHNHSEIGSGVKITILSFMRGQANEEKNTCKNKKIKYS